MGDVPAPTQQYFDTKDAAAYLSLAKTTLEKWRCYGSGPAYRKLGRRVVYATSDLDEWAAAGKRNSTSDAGCDDSPPDDHRP